MQQPMQMHQMPQLQHMQQIQVQMLQHQEATEKHPGDPIADTTQSLPRVRPFDDILPLGCFVPKYIPLQYAAYPTPSDIPYLSSSAYLCDRLDYDEPWNGQALSIMAVDVNPNLQWCSMPLTPDPVVLIG
eukprot:gnl/Chilomastix_caulleri/3273.p1 GENE.gnl/Chilomastix_caulleri/3273~~gnl/Chilomastix_caulleri/3273.p1  ORF type:complete len:130 (+),score=26.26 gnl/Chilomastix_caulleri/3273:70-459(+)